MTIQSYNTTDWVPVTAPAGTTVTIPRQSWIKEQLRQTLEDVAEGETHDVAVLWVRLPVADPNPFTTIPQPANPDGVEEIEYQPWMLAITNAGTIVPIYDLGPALNGPNTDD